MDDKNNTLVTISTLGDDYYREADRLEEYLQTLLDKVKKKPEPEELSRLEKRIEVLRAEIWDLREVAGLLAKKGSKPPLTPSLAAREKAARLRAV